MNKEYKYIIIGGGMAGANAAIEIQKNAPEGSLLIVTEEADKPYHRPPLTKELWTDPNYNEATIYYDFPNVEAIDFLTETTVTEINPKEKVIKTDQNATYQYDKLLYAIGGTPNWIEGPKSDRVLAIRHFDDYRKLRQYAPKGSNAIVVGGGWVGAELAAALQMNQVETTLVFPDEILNEKRLPLELAEKFEQSFIDADVSLINDAKADHYEATGDKVTLHLEDGQELTADVLILGIGIKPKLELAEAAGLEVGNGVIANEYLQSSDKDIYVAGDVLNYIDLIMGRKKFEHEEQAEKSGQTAGRNMTGAKEVYDHAAPLSYTDVLDISIEGVGDMSRNRDDALIEATDNGYIVYYLSNGKPSGILTYNTKVDLDQARQILANPPETTEELRGSLKPL